MENSIHIKGARGNNLQNVEVYIPKNKLVVVTGVSGSGKSTLTMDTLYAEGQRRYVESLSAYARQFLGRMKKPEVDFIKGICPAIAIEQKVTSGNNRSTVGSMTELQDYLRLLYARAGHTFSPISGDEVKKHQVADVINYLKALPEGTRAYIVAPVRIHEGRTARQTVELLFQKGYTRLFWDGKTTEIQELLEFTAKPVAKLYALEETVSIAAEDSPSVKKTKAKKTEEPKVQPLPVSDKDMSAEWEYLQTQTHIPILIDRMAIRADELELGSENANRLADSVNLSFGETLGDCIIWTQENGNMHFNARFELDGMRFEEPTPNLFNYNNPFGACPKCEGYGKTIGIDEDKVIPDHSLSVVEDCVACWKGESGSQWKLAFLQVAHKFKFPVHTPYGDLSKAERKLLWSGNEYFLGISAYFSALEKEAYKIQNRVMLARFRGKADCLTCEGSRLRKEARYVKVEGRSIDELTSMPISDLRNWFAGLKLNEYDHKVAKRILQEVDTRLRFMVEVGLGYLTLERVSNTLSGGETQRINLTRTLGSNLTSSLYILDEPSIGLHPRDTRRLVEVLKALRDLGNTVVVVEHEEDIISSADYLIDVGPEAGIHGGHIVWAGPYPDIHTGAAESLTAGYMSGRLEIPVPTHRRPWKLSINVEGARQNNLKNITAHFPLDVLTVVTGVSGSGKTTLVKQILYPAMVRHLGEANKEGIGHHQALTGDLKRITAIELVNQSPIGKSSRSNPVTYIKAYDHIRDLFAKQQLSLLRGYKPKHFSFNVEGGRCETCQGEGETLVTMQFLADVRLTCEDCGGKRFKDEVIDVKYRDKSITDILDMSVEESLEFFKDDKNIYQLIKPLNDVGLGYVKLGQSSSTLSGGEAQRVKLASFLGKERATEHILFIFDEPTTGLHFHDVKKLLKALNALVEAGHTVLVVEHNLDVIKCADWILDLGPEGGAEGGHLVFAGTPEDLVKSGLGYTAGYLKEKL